MIQGKFYPIIPKMTRPLEGNDGSAFARDFISHLNRAQPPQIFPPEIERNPEFDHWAWGRLARLLAEGPTDEVREAMGPNGTFRVLDGASSTPWNREVMRGQFRSNVCLPRTNATIMSFETDFKQRADNLPFRNMNQDKMNQVRNKILKKGNFARSFVESAVFDVLFEPYNENVDTNDLDSLANYFLKRFTSSPTRTYYEVIENATKPKLKPREAKEPGSWTSLVPATQWLSLQSVIEKETGLMPEEIDTILQSMAGHFAKQLTGNIPNVQFLSMDLADTITFAKHAHNNFPSKTIDTQFFKNALDPERHIVGDISDLSIFNDGDISVMTIFDAFPFYKKHFPFNNGVQIISEASRAIHKGGKLIVFPWNIQGSGFEEQEDLGDLESFMDMVGFEVTIEQRDKVELVKGMRERELEIVGRSPIFHEPGDTLSLLVATKRAA